MNNQSPFSIKLAENRLAIIVVVYNQKITDCEAYLILSQCDEAFNMIIFDNSNQSSILDYNREITSSMHIQWISYSKNVGLSQAYNRSIEMIRSTYPSVLWILILDQDTQLNQDYINEVLRLSEDRNASIYYPTVKTKSGIFSPVLLNPILGSNLTSSQSKKELLIPINSGILWPITLFDQVKFDERLFLDMIDYDIFFQLVSLVTPATLIQMNSVINQNFSGETKSSAEVDLIRYRIYTEDFLTFSRKWNVPKTYTLFFLIKRALRLNWTYKTLCFSQAYFNIINQKRG